MSQARAIAVRAKDCLHQANFPEAQAAALVSIALSLSTLVEVIVEAEFGDDDSG